LTNANEVLPILNDTNTPPLLPNVLPKPVGIALDVKPLHR